MFTTQFNLTGSIRAELFKADGSYEVIYKHNAILDGGFDFIANAIGSSTERPEIMKYIALGTNQDAIETSQTGLKNQIAAKEATYTHSTGTKTFQFEALFDKGEATGALTEAAVQTMESGGIAIDRVTFPVINKGAEDSLKITFIFTMSQTAP